MAYDIMSRLRLQMHIGQFGVIESSAIILTLVSIERRATRANELAFFPSFFFLIHP